MVFLTGHYQPSREAFKNAFVDGAYFGGIMGGMSSVYFRKISHIPRYAAGCGLAYGSVMLIS